MFHAASKAVFHTIAGSRLVKHFASRRGMAVPNGFARRFIAGEEVADAIETARTLQSRRFLLTLDYLGESVESFEAATAAAREYVEILRAIVQSGIERNVSLKLTQLGLDIDRATCVDNLRRVLEPAQREGFFVRIDMEGSAYTERSLAVFETLWGQQYRNVGIVLQAYLYRTEHDIRRALELGARVRLVKGAYHEPKSVAYQREPDVKASFVRLMKQLLDSGTYPAIATHDPEMIDATIAYAQERGISPDRFEFQMLYGIRRDLQATLLARGFRVRVYLPFGHQWFPYFMRRLGERPDNLLFVLRSLLRER